MATRPIVGVGAAYALGCLVAGWIRLSPSAGIAVAALGAVAAIFFYREKTVGWAILLLTVMFLAIARTTQVQIPRADDVSNLASYRTKRIITGYIATDPNVQEDKIRFTARVRSVAVMGREIPVSGQVMVRIAGNDTVNALKRKGGLAYGRSIKLEGMLQQPRKPRNPDQFDYAAYYARHGIYSTMWLRKPAEITIYDHQSGNKMLQMAFATRAAIQAVFQRWLPAQEAALSSGMVLGSYSLVHADLVENFTRSGTLHLLAASGFNCGLIITVFWFGIFRRVLMPRKLAVSCVIAVIFYYVLTTGSGPSIVRAGIAATLYLLAIMMGRPAERWSILFGTALIMLVIDPLALFDIGFQLSFAAVMSIIAFLPTLSSMSVFDHRASDVRISPQMTLRRFLLDAAAVTLAATVATIPILAHAFNSVSLVSLPANMAVAALAMLHFWASVAFIFLFWIPGLNWILSYAVWVFASAVEFVVNTAGSLPFAQIDVDTPSLLAIAAWYGVLGCIWWVLCRRKQTANVAANIDPQ